MASIGQHAVDLRRMLRVLAAPIAGLETTFLVQTQLRPVNAR